MKYQLQRGFTLLEMTIVIALGAMIAVGVAQMNFDNIERDQQAIVARQLGALSDAALAFVVTNHERLIQPAAAGTPAGPLAMPGDVMDLDVNQLTAAGVAAGMIPTLSAGVVPAGVVPILRADNEFLVRLRNQGGDLESFVYLRNPILRRGTTVPDQVALGEIASKLTTSAQIGYSQAVDGQIVGRGGVSWGPGTNPVVPAVPGIIVVRSSFNESAFNAYVRRDGTLEMRGALKMNGQNVENAANIVSTGNITASGDVISRTGNINALGEGGIGGHIISERDVRANKGNIYTAAGDIVSERDVRANTGNIYTAEGHIISERDVRANTGNIYTVDGDVIAQKGNINARGSMSADSAEIRSVKAVGGACTERIVVTDGSGALMTCIDGRWKKQGELAGYEFVSHVEYGYGNVGSTAKCSAGKIVLSGGCSTSIKSLKSIDTTHRLIESITTRKYYDYEGWLCVTHDSANKDELALTAHAVCATRQ